MPWVRDGDDLKSVGVRHYDVGEIRRLIEELRQSRNQPGTVSSLLEDLLSTGRAPRELVWRLCKWCDWNDPSERIARAIADQLFHGIRCRRLRDQAGRPIPDRATAEADYQRWLDLIVQTGLGLPQSAVFPDEVDQAETYLEGAVHRVSVNAHERDPAARAKCLAHYGTACSVCGFEFGKAYDGIGQGFIHVHHLRKLSKIGDEHEVDPIADMRPVCPNCHAAIHFYREPFTIEEVKAMVARSRERTMPAHSPNQGMQPAAQEAGGR